MGNKICIIIPVKGEGLRLAQCLEAIFELDYSCFEVIVVDDGLEGKGVGVLNDFKDKIKILKNNGKGPAYARNLAAKNSDVEFLAFTDSDCLVDKNWLKELTQGFSKYSDAVACGGRQLLPSDATEFEKKVYAFMEKTGFITDYMNKRKDKIIEVNHNPSCNVMYKREVFLKEDGFLEDLWPGEDVELDYRLKRKGYKIIFNPKAAVYHYKPKKLKDFLKMMSRYGEAQGFLVRKYGMFRKIHFIPFLSLLFIFGGAYGIFLEPKSAYLGIIGAINMFVFFRLEVIGFIFWNIGFWRGVKNDCFLSFFWYNKKTFEEILGIYCAYNVFICKK